MEDFFAAGGVGALLQRLGAHVRPLDARPCTGETLGDWVLPRDAPGSIRR